MVRGAGCHEINLRIRRREKNVLDIPFYRPGVCAQNPDDERNGDVSTSVTAWFEGATLALEGLRGYMEVIVVSRYCPATSQ
jgi:hypothetical protein